MITKTQMSAWNARMHSVTGSARLPVTTYLRMRSNSMMPKTTTTTIASMAELPRPSSPFGSMRLIKSRKAMA